MLFAVLFQVVTLPVEFDASKRALEQVVDLNIVDEQENRQRRIQSSTLNEIVVDAVSMNPTPMDKGKRLNIFYASQVAINPPTFVFFVNYPELMHFSYERFLETRIRDSFNFEGTPIQLLTRQRN